VRWTVADPATIRTFIDRIYRANDEIDRLVKAFEVGDDQSKAAAIAAEVSLDDQAPIIQLVSRIVSQAMRDRTSDITSSRSTRSCASGSASTVTSSRRSASTQCAIRP
jgi:type II secretory ATPase GspE/PulE/Tfp pilus assembly ATPase PilB-like protein